jgi:hypothetical protein
MVPPFGQPSAFSTPTTALPLPKPGQVKEDLEVKQE